SGVPASKDAVVMTGDQAATVGAVRHSPNIFPEAAQRERSLVCRRIPQLHRRIVEAARGEQVSRGTESEAPHATGVPAQGAYFLAACQVPKLDSAIGTGGGKPPTIGRLEPHVAHVGGMAAKDTDFLSTLGVPNADGPINAGRDKALPIRAKLKALDHGRVATQSKHFGTGRRVPDREV